MRDTTILFATLLLTSSACAAGEPEPWEVQEAANLRNPVQLTSPDRFVKAGESYFSPDGSRMIFQAIEVPEDDAPADEFYAMYVADVVRDDSGHVTGLDHVRRISPPGSANTCGWFHPFERDVVLFASTVHPPRRESEPPGYQRASKRYRWMFPPSMDIVSVRLDRADGTEASPQRMVSNPDAYIAEGSWSPDGRYLLYCSLASNEGDLYVRDVEHGTETCLVSAHGYDGGPFFSPDGRRICYRSDRRGDNELQLFVADLARDPGGAIVGVEREYQLTDNEHVNWCPFWHPDGRHLVYSTSEISHHNYELFVLDADPGDLPGSNGTIRYGTRKRRVTFAPGADVLPAFSPDGRILVWTSKRGPAETSQLWAADFVMDLDGRPVPETEASH